MLERTKVNLSEGFRVGEATVIPTRNIVLSSDHEVHLEPKIMDVCLFLAERCGEVVSRDELIGKIWKVKFGSDESLTRAIYILRKAFSHSRSNNIIIETIPKKGYRLAVSVKPIKRQSEALNQVDSQELEFGAPEMPPTGSLGLQAFPKSRETDLRGAMPSLAILPFTNRSQIEDDEVFAEGMVEDIVAALSQSAAIRVLGTISTVHLKKDVFLDLAAIGEQLGVRYLLEGNVRRTGRDFRVTTQLIAPKTGELVWSGQFNKPLNDLQELQEELVTEVAVALGVKIQVLDMERALRKPTDLTAWDAIQRCILAMRRVSAEAMQSAIKEARRAVDLAPDYALAHAILANASATLYMIDSPDDPLEISHIQDHAKKALELDSDSASVLSSVASAYANTGDPEEGLRWATKAYGIAPNNGLVAQSLGSCHALLNQTEEAMQYLEISYAMMPGSHLRVWSRTRQANVMVRERRFAEAEAYLDESHIIDPAFRGPDALKAWLCWHDGRHDQAIQILSTLQKAGLDLATTERLIERNFINSSISEEILTETKHLWAAIEA
ncbi:winged helix-turn-helix domain-containing protein [Sphingorhabdus sp. Alg231-15]|uniref:winged helix-turn-helix domain-containing protein n=1 Tax=Sphingorhabdus sp. Alg231-15 TaxID=1922222 RepID=UPI000D55C001